MKRLALYFLCLLLFAINTYSNEGNRVSENSIGMKLIDISAGSFMMGSPDDEPWRTNGEKRHKVTLTHDFKVGKFEVTQAEWEKVMGFGMKKLYEKRKAEDVQRRAKEKELYKNRSSEEKKALVAARKEPDGKRQNPKNSLNEEQKKDLNITRKEIKSLKETYKKEVKAGTHISYGDKFPVGFVSWNEAMEFCQKLTELEKENGNLPEGWIYRLPTEAEWEYVCRAGTQTPTFLGKQPEPHDRKSVEAFKKVAWGNTNAGDKTHKVGSLEPNPWGLHDIYGNVTEWCLDIYAAFTDDEQINPLVLEGPNMMRVSRGLNSHCTLSGFRSATRKTGGPRMPFYALFGFRVVCSPEGAVAKEIPPNHTNL